jgi:hypothetical protein
MMFDPVRYLVRFFIIYKNMSMGIPFRGNNLFQNEYDEAWKEVDIEVDKIMSEEINPFISYCFGTIISPIVSLISNNYYQIIQIFLVNYFICAFLCFILFTINNGKCNSKYRIRMASVTPFIIVYKACQLATGWLKSLLQKIEYILKTFWLKFFLPIVEDIGKGIIKIVYWFWFGIVYPIIKTIFNKIIKCIKWIIHQISSIILSFLEL